jgi:hypothetical protein
MSGNLCRIKGYKCTICKKNKANWQNILNDVPKEKICIDCLMNIIDEKTLFLEKIKMIIKVKNYSDYKFKKFINKKAFEYGFEEII